MGAIERKGMTMVVSSRIAGWAGLWWLSVALTASASAQVPDNGILVHDNGIVVQQSDSLVFQSGRAAVDAVQAVVNAAGASSAQALVSQIQIGNVMEEGLTASLAIARDSFQNNRGIVGANQNSGNLNNQANVQVIARVSNGPLIQLGQATVEQRLVDNTMVTSGAAREDRIQNSFGGTIGIAAINQSAGNLNNQANVMVINLGADPEFVALEESSLGAVNSGNRLIQGPPGPKSDVIVDSFAGFRGLAQINQSAGDLNSVSNTMNVSLSSVTLR